MTGRWGLDADTLLLAKPCRKSDLAKMICAAPGGMTRFNCD